MLQILKPREYIFLYLSARESFDSVEGPLRNGEEIDKTVRKRSVSADRKMRLLTMKVFKHLHGLPARNTLYVSKSDELSERSAVEQLCFTALALLSVFATPEN